MKAIKLLIFIPLFLGIVSCSHREIFFEYRSFSNAEWKQDDSAVFNVKVENNSQACDMSVEVRNDNTYPFSNIWLFIDCKSPDGNIRTDTIGADLAGVNGKWHGKGLSLHNLSIPYKKSFLFPNTGIYVYSIRQGMRDNPLKGISDVALKISKKSGK